MKTLAIRLEEEQHAQLTMIAQLEGLTVTDAIRQSIDQWVNERKNNPQLKARAESILEEIEKEASTRRSAIAALLGEENPSPSDRPTGRGPRKGGDATS